MKSTEQAILIESLIQFGLTRQEALLYLCLHENQELTGYEAAKLTGISRSNVYSSLSAMVDHGAAYLIEGNPSKYVAVKLEEFCENRQRMLEQKKIFLQEHMPSKILHSEGYITIVGYQNILDKVHHMLLDAKMRIYLSAPHEFINLLQSELTRLSEDAIKVVLITDDVLEVPDTFLYMAKKRESQIHLIIDSEYVLTGEITGKSTDTCLYSGQKNFVNVLKEALRNEIKIITYMGKEEKAQNE